MHHQWKITVYTRLINIILNVFVVYTLDRCALVDFAPRSQHQHLHYFRWTWSHSIAHATAQRSHTIHIHDTVHNIRNKITLEDTYIHTYIHTYM